jgi:hypothetical protein
MFLEGANPALWFSGVIAGEISGRTLRRAEARRDGAVFLSGSHNHTRRELCRHWSKGSPYVTSNTEWE